MKHFALKELCASVIAEELGIANNPAPSLGASREALGNATHVNSGYRSAKRMFHTVLESIDRWMKCGMII